MHGNITYANATQKMQLEAIDVYSLWYRQYHGYVSATVCAIGILSNFWNAIVLTRKGMSTPTNLILTALALADIVIMSFYFVNAIYFYCITEPFPIRDHPYGWVLFLTIQGLVTNTFHNAGLWLTNALAIFRIVTLKANVGFNAKKYCPKERRKAKLAIGLVLLGAVIISVPNYMAYSIQQIPLRPNAPKPGTNETLIVVWWQTESALAAKNNGFLFVFNFWLHIVVRLGASITLMISTCILIHILRHALLRRLRIMNNNPVTSRGSSETTHQTNQTTQTPLLAPTTRPFFELGSRPVSATAAVPTAISSHNQTDFALARQRTYSMTTTRTSRMLFGVIFLVIIAELPHGILMTMVAIEGKQFVNEVYAKLGDTMDMLVLLECALTFPIYCCMSEKFRRIFNETVLKLLKKLFPCCGISTLRVLACQHGSSRNNNSSIAIEVMNGVQRYRFEISQDQAMQRIGQSTVVRNGGSTRNTCVGNTPCLSRTQFSIHRAQKNYLDREGQIRREAIRNQFKTTATNPTTDYRSERPITLHLPLIEPKRKDETLVNNKTESIFQAGQLDNRANGSQTFNNTNSAQNSPGTNIKFIDLQIHSEGVTSPDTPNAQWHSRNDDNDKANIQIMIQI